MTWRADCYSRDYNMTDYQVDLLERLENDAQPLHEAEAELCLAQLRNMNTIYTTIIEKKQAEMKYQKYVLEAARTRDEAQRARQELRTMQSKCVDLYAFWLKELLDMQISYDKRAFTLHQMLFGNCQWFLAKYGSLKTKASPNCKTASEGYDEAIAAYDRIFAILGDDLPSCNAFYVFLLKKYSQLVLDAKQEAAGIAKRDSFLSERSTPSGYDASSLPFIDRSPTNFDEAYGGPSTAFGAVTPETPLEDFSKDCENDIEQNYAKMDSKLYRQGMVAVSPEITKEKSKAKRLLRCKQAAVNCLRHLNRLRQSLQFGSSGYVPRSIRSGIEDVNKILLQIQQISLAGEEKSTAKKF